MRYLIQFYDKQTCIDFASAVWRLFGVRAGIYRGSIHFDVGWLPGPKMTK